MIYKQNTTELKGAVGNFWKLLLKVDQTTHQSAVGLATTHL